MLEFFAVYFAAVSLLGVVLVLADKRAAVKHRWRISEKTLMLVGFFGGALFEYITMKLIRHKTLRKKFMIGLPLMIAFHIGSAVFICLRFFGHAF